MSPIYESGQRLERLKRLRNEVDLEIRLLEREHKAAARRARRRRARRRFGREGIPIAGGVRPRAVREWALSQGLDVGMRGRVREDIVQAYVEAHR